MRKVTIELDDKYADVLTFTAIGHGSGFDRNVFCTALDLLRYTEDHLVFEMILKDGDVTKTALVKKEE